MPYRLTWKNPFHQIQLPAGYQESNRLHGGNICYQCSPFYLQSGIKGKARGFLLIEILLPYMKHWNSDGCHICLTGCTKGQSNTTYMQ